MKTNANTRIRLEARFRLCGAFLQNFAWLDRLSKSAPHNVHRHGRDQISHYCILDETGNVILEQRVPTTPKRIQQVFGKISRRRIALESGTHSPWLSRLLTQLGHEVIVAHARNVQLITESSRKDDRLDARTLAKLARIDPELLGPVRHRSAKAQIHLTVIRARATLVSARTALVNAARGLTKSYGERLAKCGTEQMNREIAKGLNPELRDVLEPLFVE